MENATITTNVMVGRYMPNVTLNPNTIKSFRNEKNKKTNAQGRRCSGAVEVWPHKKR